MNKILQKIRGSSNMWKVWSCLRTKS